LAEVISRVVQAVLGDLIPLTEYYIMARCFPFGLAGHSKGFWQRYTGLPLKGLGERRICRQQDCVVNQAEAKGAVGCVDKSVGVAEDLREGPQTFGAGNQDVLLPGGVLSVLWNPEGRQDAGIPV
jgi:hypothetical protein